MATRSVHRCTGHPCIDARVVTPIVPCTGAPLPVHGRTPVLSNIYLAEDL